MDALVQDQEEKDDDEDDYAEINGQPNKQDGAQADEDCDDEIMAFKEPLPGEK